MWLHVDGIGPVRFNTLDHVLDLQIDEPHDSYGMSSLGHVTVSAPPDGFPLVPFTGSAIVALRHVRQRSLGSRVGFQAWFPCGSVRILALADELVVTADQLPDCWEDDLDLEPQSADPVVEMLLGVLTDQTPACGAVRDAVFAGGASRIDEGLVSAASLAGTYASRLEHTRARGIETVGLPESVRALEEYGDRPVRLGSVDSADGSWHFVLFFSADSSSLVACTGVRQVRV
ncbi:hypothetical protein GCM10010442_33030 [Kitasatospora kifunensis]